VPKSLAGLEHLGVSRPSRRDFLKLALQGTGGAVMAATLAMVGRAARPVDLNPEPVRCSETELEILNVAATAEALAITFYYQSIQGSFFGVLPAVFQAYLQAALDEEHAHLNYLVSQGANPAATRFYFPGGIFDSLPRFLPVLDRLENAFIAGYLAAARRFAEMGNPVLTEIALQVMGVEAEHRVLGRELSQPPEAPNDLCLEQASAWCVADVLSTFQPFIGGSGGYTGPFDQPTDAQVAAAVADRGCTAVDPATAAAGCSDSVADILNVAATAEALAITFYYQSIQGGFFHALPELQQWYLQAALDEERTHFKFLQANGASPATTDFYFPNDVFNDLNTFVVTLDLLENAFIAAYLAASQRFAQLGQPLLAEIAGQIMGVEAEHRVVGRVIGEQIPANNLCLERASLGCVAEAAGALQPFLAGVDGYAGPYVQPADGDVTVAVGRFGCKPVPTVRPIYRMYFPIIRQGPVSSGRLEEGGLEGTKD
jgi:hypothetical protein